MGRINRNIMENKVEKKITSKLWKAFSFFDSPHKAQTFWEKFLTTSEIVILSKRLEIFRMAIEKKPYETIKDRLKVSANSISRAQNTLRKHGSYLAKTILHLTS